MTDKLKVTPDELAKINEAYWLCKSCGKKYCNGDDNPGSITVMCSGLCDMCGCKGSKTNFLTPIRDMGYIKDLYFRSN